MNLPRVLRGLEAPTNKGMPRITKFSRFQEDKFCYYFKFFDRDEDGYIEESDFPLLAERILRFTGWAESDQRARASYEIHKVFLESIQEKADENEDKKITLEEWMEFWARITYGCMGMGDFPLWVQYLPHVLFSIIDTNCDGLLDVQEIAHFYRDFVGLKDAENLAQTAFDAWTDKGHYKLNLATYNQMFANFLLSRHPYGPGRYIFGCFEYSAEAEPFRIQPAMADED